MKKPAHKIYETCDLMHGNICVSKPCICKGMSMSKKRKQHGGKRKGSGRPKLKDPEKKEPTKVIRVPVSKIEAVKKLITKGFVNS